MTTRKSSFSTHLLAIFLAFGVFVGASYAQVSINLQKPFSAPANISTPASDKAPSECFKVTATASGSPATVILYKNDVPYQHLPVLAPHTRPLSPAEPY